MLGRTVSNNAQPKRHVPGILGYFIAALVFVAGPVALAGDPNPGSDGNGTLPAQWNGYVQIDGSGLERPARMEFSYVDETTYLPSELGCNAYFDWSAEAHLIAGLLQVSGINIIFYLSVVCVSGAHDSAEVVAVDARGHELHLRGALANKKFGMMFSGNLLDGSRFLFVEDKLPE